MWLFTPCGFFSVVAKPEDVTEDTVTIRTRLKGDLDELRKKFMPGLGATVTGAGNDYPYRARIARVEFAEGMRRIAMDLNYGDFKSTVFEQQGANRARVYGKIWRDLIELEDDNPTLKDSAAEPRMAWKLAKTVQSFRHKYGHWPSRIEMPKSQYNALLLDVGQLWHKPMLEKLSFSPAECGIKALDQEGLSTDYAASKSEEVDHREAFAWMFD